MLEVNNLTKQYGSNYAVRDLQFSMKKGEVVGLIGRNGAGKTTTLRMLTGILNPTSGTAQIDGYDIIKQPDAIRARIGFLPDSPPLYGEMTVEAFLRFVAGSKSVANDQVGSKVEKVMVTTNIADHRYEIINRLSHGYRQRVALAQTLVNDPPLLILDEPSSGLDPIQAHEFQQLILSLRDKHTILYSTHNLDEVVQTCNRVLIIEHGLLIAEYTHKQVIEQIPKARTLDLQVRGDGERIRLLLGEKGTITDFHPLLSGSQLIRARISDLQGDNPVESICNTLWKEGIEVISFEIPELTLEQFFISHVEQGGQA